MSKAISYVVTHEHGRWVGRCPTEEVGGVAVADSLTRLERELNEAHMWVWPHDTPSVTFVFNAEVPMPYGRCPVCAEPLGESDLSFGELSFGDLSFGELVVARAVDVPRRTRRLHQVELAQPVVVSAREDPEEPGQYSTVRGEPTRADSSRARRQDDHCAQG